MKYRVIVLVHGPRNDEIERSFDMDFPNPESAKTWIEGYSCGLPEWETAVSIFNKEDWPEELVQEITEALEE